MNKIYILCIKKNISLKSVASKYDTRFQLKKVIAPKHHLPTLAVSKVGKRKQKHYFNYLNLFSKVRSRKDVPPSD